MTAANEQVAHISAYGAAQRTREGQRVRLEFLPDIELLVYPNVIELWYEGRKSVAWTPEQWAEMVHRVGIVGFA